MKGIRFVLIFMLASTTPLHAQNTRVNVLAARFVPPYVIQAKDQVYGFDVSMMMSLCEKMQYDCQFQVVDLTEVLPGVASGEADLGIGAIAILGSRLQTVNFTLPYLPSRAMFLGQAKWANRPFDNDFLANKRFGVVQASAFRDEITSMGINNPTIVSFDSETDMISALANDQIDLAMLDEATTRYWQNHSDGTLKAIGNPIPYAMGLAIVVNKNNMPLLEELNNALASYIKSPEYQQNYQTYFPQL